MRIRPLYRTRTKLILSFVGVCLILGTLSLVAGGRTITTAVLQEATNRISQDLNAAWEIYNGYERLFAVAVELTARENDLPHHIAARDWVSLEPRLGQLLETTEADIAGICMGDASWSLIVSSQNVIRAGETIPCPSTLVVHGQDSPVSGTATLTAAFLEVAGLSSRARIALIPTPRAAPRTETVEESGMVISAARPIRLQDGSTAVLYAAKLVNRCDLLVDRIRDTVFQKETLDGEPIGTATVFFGDVRVATNVRDQDGNRAIGTRVSEEVKEWVLDRGERWSDRAFVVNDWYRTAYDPIVDISGQRVGALYVGVLDAKYQRLRRQTLSLFAIITAGGVAISILIGYLLGRAMLAPVNRLIDASRRVSDGDLDPQIGPVSRDEIGVLQHTFAAMLASIRERAEQEREKHRQSLIRSEQQASVGRLAAGVAHEINNPLTSVLTFTHLLLERTDLSEDARSDLQIIADSTERVRSIVRDLLDFSRQTRLEAERTDIATIIANAITLVRNQAHSSGITLAADIPDSLPHITIDAGRVQGVLINLLLNAFDATPVDGLVKISAEYREDPHDAESGMIAISVSDTGTGIEPEDLDRIFDPFFTTKAAGQGTGLGLAVSLGIVKQHGGDIGVSSKPGAGSTFVVSLPVNQPLPERA